MIKLIVIGGLVGAAIMWLRLQASNMKAKSASKKLTDSLKTGKLDFASLAGSLGMRIRSKTLSPGFDMLYFSLRVGQLSGLRLLNKFTISHVEKDRSGNCIVIAEAVIKDITPSSPGVNQQVDVIYPCWLYIQRAAAETMEFSSSFPQNKDHQYLLEDLADHIYEQYASK